MISPFRWVVFDAFGTLLDYGMPLRLRALDALCREQGFPSRGAALYTAFEEAIDAYHREKGPFKVLNGQPPPFASFRERYDEYFRRAFATLGIQGDERRATEFFLRAYGACDLFPEARETLRWVQRRCRTAVLSNADNDFLSWALDKHRLTFDTVLTSEMIGVYKPHPAVFRALLEKLDCPPSHVLYVGDQLFDDVQGARQVKIPVAWLNRDGKGVPQGHPQPDYTLDNLEALISVLEGMASSYS